MSKSATGFCYSVPEWSYDGHLPVTVAHCSLMTEWVHKKSLFKMYPSVLMFPSFIGTVFLMFAECYVQSHLFHVTWHIPKTSDNWTTKWWLSVGYDKLKTIENVFSMGDPLQLNPRNVGIWLAVSPSNITLTWKYEACTTVWQCFCHAVLSCFGDGTLLLHFPWKYSTGCKPAPGKQGGGEAKSMTLKFRCQVQ